MAEPLDELVTTITSEVATVKGLLKATGSPSLSFHQSSALPTNTRFSDPKHVELQVARNKLINAAHDLLLLAQGPIDTIASLSMAGVDAANLATVTQFELPQKVPLDSTISIKDLAAATPLLEDHVTRIVRLAITNGIFLEPEPGIITHSALSRTLATNQAAHDVGLFVSASITRLAAPLADSLEATNGNPGPHDTFRVAYPGYNDFFEYMSKDAHASKLFFNHLDGRSKLPRYSVETVLTAWDWESIGNGTIVDVGGSSGHTAVALAKHVPTLKVIVQDQNVTALDMGRKAVADDADLKQRVTFQDHDFFTPQKQQADVYFLRHILHDWPDEDCVRILKALVPALKSGARVMISEGVIPQPPSTRSALLDDKHVRFDDFVMLATCMGAERSVSQYQALFEAASPQFSFVAETGKGTGVHMSLLEFKFEGASCNGSTH